MNALPFLKLCWKITIIKKYVHLGTGVLAVLVIDVSAVTLGIIGPSSFPTALIQIYHQ